MSGLYDSTTNFDLNSVGVPVTGIAAFCLAVTAENVIKDTDLGGPSLALPAGYLRLGLYKEDGGVEEGRDDEDATSFFQEGEKLAGASTQTVSVGLAEDNVNVNRLIDGKEPDENGVVYVDSSLPDAKFILFIATRYKNGFELRRNGVARIQSVEVDQEERGSVKAKKVTFEWVPDALFNNAPYKKWLGVPGGITVQLDQQPASVAVSKTIVLHATVTPSNGQTIVWTSSDPLTAKVENGTVTGVKAGGPVTITASVGKQKATCKVTVQS